MTMTTTTTNGSHTTTTTTTNTTNTTYTVRTIDVTAGMSTATALWLVTIGVMISAAGLLVFVKCRGRRSALSSTQPPIQMIEVTSRCSRTLRRRSSKSELMGTFDSAGRNVEVVFCFDTTGSMYSCLQRLREKLRETCRRLLRDIPNMRIGMMANGDYCDYDKYVVRYVDVTTDVETLVDFAEHVPSTGGGGNGGEAYEWALRKAQQLDWSENSAKAFVMIGDELPHKPSMTDLALSWRAELDVLTGMGVKVYGVHALNRTESKPFYEELAERSGGYYLPLAHFDLITDMFLAVCYREADPGQLDAFVEEVEKEGRMTAETKVLLSRLEEVEPTQEQIDSQPTRYVGAAWWDHSLDNGTTPDYEYVQETDTFRPRP